MKKFKYIWREGIHGVFLTGVKFMRDFKLQIENKQDFNTPVLYAAVHTNFHDVPVIMEAIKKHSYLLASDEVKGHISGLLFESNGVVYIHRQDKESCKNASNNVISTLKDGKSVLMFPEGTWNVTPSSPILNLKWGFVDIAMNANVPIVPIVTEYLDDRCIIRFGEPIVIDKNSFDSHQEYIEYKKQKLDELEESLSTMKWDIWTQYGGTYNREDGDLNKKRLDKYKKEYSDIDYEYESQFIYNPVQYLEDICPINVVEVNQKKRTLTNK